jgi:hypothetical protein
VRARLQGGPHGVEPAVVVERDILSDADSRHRTAFDVHRRGDFPWAQPLDGSFSR